MGRLTKKEQEWIADLEKVIARMPKNLMIFADGQMYILKPLKGGDPNCMLTGGYGHDKNCIVHTIVCDCDGGSF